MTKESKYFTAVFEVKDKEKFMEVALQISKSMFEGTFYGANATGCRWGDSMAEADALRTYLEDKGEDVDQIISDFIAGDK